MRYDESLPVGNKECPNWFPVGFLNQAVIWVLALPSHFETVSMPAKHAAPFARLLYCVLHSGLWTPVGLVDKGDQEGY